jgi:hypothetical protein
MDHQDNGETLDKSYLNETTTPATTAEYLQLLQSIISHPSSKGATIQSLTSLLLVHIATTVKATEPKKNTLSSETRSTLNK